MMAPGWRAAGWRAAAPLLPILLAGCDAGPSHDAETPAAVTVQAVPQVESARPAPVRATAPPALPTPENRPPLTEMAPQKPFTDPPLPRELLDDGDLIPLPSPPQRR
ncbi:hypothetical protein SAMN05428974_0972 [Sphingopyxis sp. YR583]|uniref:hypothetical protein n=1 Tax=Sphingopyxis sp. YR583 TaxID=1881047 RepID=UPI0008A7AFD4|nr:hypothetical protein [Sphingopyxis sp. YR583]SEH13850.1 hypothetical protein SAMN05428974_0972 [Sphingopyxis sp. YR583]